MRFSKRVAFVTGGGSGIGAATALLLASQGAAVAIADINTENASKTANAIKSGGGQSLALQVDVSAPDQVEAAIAEVVKTFGGLHLACNNAGTVGTAQKTGDATLEAWRRTLGINLDGIFHCMRHEIPAMQAYGGGSIVNTASIMAHRAVSHQTGYSASKSGILGLSRTAAVEYARRNIRVNTVSPGIIDTPLLNLAGGGDHSKMTATVPMRRMGSPDEVATVVAFLLSDEASYVTGTDIIVDGGLLA